MPPDVCSNVIPAPFASEASEREQAGTQSTLLLAHE